jgi:trehalose 6-phosphate synthase/phosphatase
MEYVLCQKGSKNPLILSEFTGVTGSMLEAIRVNPWDANGCARAINQCLTMEEEEKQRRHASLYKRVTTQTAAVWAHTLVLRLLESLKQDPASGDTPSVDVGLLESRYQKSNKRLLMFDYGKMV